MGKGEDFQPARRIHNENGERFQGVMADTAELYFSRGEGGEVKNTGGHCVWQGFIINGRRKKWGEKQKGSLYL